MKKSLSIQWTLFSLITLVVGAAWIWASKTDPGMTTEGRIPLPQAGFAAPDFSLQTLNGDTITLSDLRGRPVLINLWATWCPPCEAEMPAFERAYQEYSDQGFVILAVNATNQDAVEDVKAFVENYGLPFPILLDTTGEVSRQYQLRSLPTSFFVDQTGVIREVVPGGPMSEALLRIRVEELLKESP